MRPNFSLQFEDMIKIVQTRGEFLLNNIELSKKHELKEEDKTVVTELDKQLNTRLTLDLSSAFQGLYVLGEETKGAIPKTNEFCVVDPLDGTAALLEGSSEYSIQAAYIKDGQVLMGVVHQPAINKTYAAEKGKGAWTLQNGVYSKINVSDSKSVLIGKYNIDDALKDELMSRFGKTVDDVVMGGGFGVKICQLAEGKHGIFLHTNYNKKSIHASIWDSAPPEIILTEAGGKAHELKTGKPINYSLDEIALTRGYIAKGYSF